MVLTYVLLFIFGLVVGSFLNVVIYREIEGSDPARRSPPSEESFDRPSARAQAEGLRTPRRRFAFGGVFRQWLPGWVFGRSYCDHCRRALAWYDNIPLLSYILLRGKCRFCGEKISFQYPLVELLTAVEFVWIYWLLARFSFFGRLEGFYSFALLVYWLYIFSSLVVIFVIDLKSGIIPDWLVWPAILISILRLFESGRWFFLLAGVAAAAFFLALFLVTRGKGLGFGDVKLGLLLGLFLGLRGVVVAIFLAFLTGAALAVILILLGKKRFGQKIAFGPFLVTGAIVAKIWGEMIWGWYMQLLNC